MTKASGEYKYQMIKLIKSGRTLSEAKAMAKAVTVGLTDEYVSQTDKRNLLSLEGTLSRLTRTRSQAVDLMKIRFGPRDAYPSTREETLAKWASGYRGNIPLSWERDGNLIRRGRPNKPKPGSSKGKVGRTRVVGAKKAESNLRELITTLQKLMRKHGKADVGALRKATKEIRVDASTKR